MGDKFVGGHALLTRNTNEGENGVPLASPPRGILSNFEHSKSILVVKIDAQSM
jgi:hypothetical protein